MGPSGARVIAIKENSWPYVQMFSIRHRWYNLLNLNMGDSMGTAALKLPPAGDAQEISAETAIRPDEGIGDFLLYLFLDVVEV